MKKVSIIMVNHNGAKYIGKSDLQDIVESFLQTDYPNFEFIFVDSGSIDESISLVKEVFCRFPAIPTKIVASKKNVGFAGGCNIGISVSEGEYICLVNNDDKPVDASWLKKLIKALESDKTIGAVFSKKLKWDNPSVVDARGMTINPAGFVAESTNLSDERISPCLIWQTPVLFRKDLISKIGGKFFDNDYVILHDDTDSSLRIWLVGYKILYVPSSVVLHKRSATMKKLPVEFVVFHGRKNIIQTLIKNYQLKNLLKWLPILLLVYLSATLYYIIINRLDQAKGTFRAILWNILNIRKLIRKRIYTQRYIRKELDDVILKLMRPFRLSELIGSKKTWPR